MASVIRKNPVIRVSIPTQISYAIGRMFQQSMINTLRRNNESLEDDAQTILIMKALNIKEFSGSSFPDSKVESYESYIRRKVMNSKCPVPASSGSVSGSSSGGDDSDDDDDSSSSGSSVVSEKSA